MVIGYHFGVKKFHNRALLMYYFDQIYKNATKVVVADKSSRHRQCQRQRILSYVSAFVVVARLQCEQKKILEG